LFDRMNRQLEKHISALEDEMEKLRLEQTRSSDFSILVKSITDRLEKGELTNEMVSAAVSSIVVHDETVTIDLKYKMA